ncbi:MAG: hypothetical protein AAF726_16850 [Planctomycetota bacterium]
MTSTAPSQTTPRSPESAPAPSKPDAKTGGVGSGARAALRKLLGRDKARTKKDDPNIYPLF